MIYKVISTSTMGGLTYTVAYLEGEDLEGVYESYKKARRDLYDPYAFIEYALKNDFIKVKEPTEKSKKTVVSYQFN